MWAPTPASGASGTTVFQLASCGLRTSIATMRLRGRLAVGGEVEHLPTLSMKS
jgi:hypothetical protein